MNSEYEQYERKLDEWEAEGYDVSEFRARWFPSRKAKGEPPGRYPGAVPKRFPRWGIAMLVVAVISIGVGVWYLIDSSSSPPYYPPPTTTTYYSLSTSVSPSGSGSISPSSGTYDAGSTVSLTAHSSSGYEFDHWGGDASGSSSSTSITMTSNKRVTAYFVAQDTDGDGLTDEEERRIGTNPGYADTDHDGLNDYEEVKVKRTDPLDPDTDGDGVEDGDDLIPFYDAYVRVSIKYFEDTSAPGEGPEDGASPGDPFFKVLANGSIKGHNISSATKASSLHNPFSVSFDVPDNSRFVLIEVEVWDHDSWSANDRYDASSKPGSDRDGLVYKKQFDLLSGTVTETSDGAADGVLQGPQAKIIVEIKTVPQE